MSLNKPKYTLIKNTIYAMEGLVDLVKHESSFRLQILLFVVMNVVAWLLPLALHFTLILSISLFIPIMAETANSAIERTVDLVTLEYHPMAKRAKDVGATLVFFALLFTGLIWLGVLYIGFLA